MKQRLIYTLIALLFSTSVFPQALGAQDSDLVRIGTFDVDASPPVGAPLAYDPTTGIQTPLSCRGIVIAGAGTPIVMVAVDWIGISGGGQTVFKNAIAQAVGTDPSRVVIHALHQHDAPRCDFDAEALLEREGITGAGFDPVHAHKVVADAAEAAKEALEKAKPVTHLGTGQGIVKDVASNRRILGRDGKVLITRYTATKDPEVRAMPVGTIDPELKMVSFWNGDKAVATEVPVVLVSIPGETQPLRVTDPEQIARLQAAGLTTIAQAVDNELRDVARALRALDQSYAIRGFQGRKGGGDLLLFKQMIHFRRSSVAS